jgi:hypothetical protein
MELALLFGGDSGSRRLEFVRGKAVASSRSDANAVLDSEVVYVCGGEEE